MRLRSLALPSFALGLLLVQVPSISPAQFGYGGEMQPLSPKYEAEATRLRAAAPQQYDFTKAVFADVLRLLATDAGISFYSLSDDSPEGSKLITFTIQASPFQALETLCKANACSLIPDNGIWYMRPADDKELVGKSYAIMHNALETVKKIVSTGASSSSGGGSGGTPSISLDLQGAQETFETKRSEIINDIRAILDLPLTDETGKEVDNQSAASAPAMDADAAIKASNSNELSALHKPKIIWKSDSNTLYIVATRLQHLWVEGYLMAADKPQPLIAIEVKFIETSNDPKRELGVDWTGTLGENGTFRQVSEVDYEEGTVETQPTTSGGGFRADLSNLLQPENLAEGGKYFVAPQFGILSAQDLSIKLRALLRDEDTKTVSYPRMVTMNNREVALRSVVNKPVLSSSSSSSLGSGATTQSEIAYLPIGTVLNILPKKMDRDKIMLNIAVTLSSIIGTEIIQGNPFPIATSRLYSAPVEVNSGYTVAIGGLDEARESESVTGVPILSRIPLLGYAFKYKSKNRNHKNLMLFITPYLIDAKEGGLPDEPQSVVRQKPGFDQPKPRVDAASGALIGGADAVPASIDYLKTEAEKLTRTIAEGRGLPEDTKKLTELRTAVFHLRRQVSSLKVTNPDRAGELAVSEAELDKLISKIVEAQRQVFVRKYF